DVYSVGLQPNSFAVRHRPDGGLGPCLGGSPFRYGRVGPRRRFLWSPDRVQRDGLSHDPARRARRHRHTRKMDSVLRGRTIRGDTRDLAWRPELRSSDDLSQPQPVYDLRSRFPDVTRGRIPSRLSLVAAGILGGIAAISAFTSACMDSDRGGSPTAP